MAITRDVPGKAERLSVQHPAPGVCVRPQARTLVHHKSVDAVRRESVVRRWTVSSDAEAEDWSVPRAPGADEVAIGSVLAAQVRAALDRLPAEQRQTVILSYFGGYSQGQIADLTAVPLGTVKSRMFAGVQRLRMLLEPLINDLSSADRSAAAATENRGSGAWNRRTDTCHEPFETLAGRRDLGKTRGAVRSTSARLGACEVVY